MRGKGNREPQDRRGHRSDPCPELPSSNPVRHQEQHRNARRRDESRDREVEMAHILEQRWAELLDLVLPHVDLVGPDPELQERVREVAETGVDFISVGALTHSAPAVDLSMAVTV